MAGRLAALPIAGGGAQPFTGLSRVELEFIADGLECHDISHFLISFGSDEDR